MQSGNGSYGEFHIAVFASYTLQKTCTGLITIGEILGDEIFLAISQHQGSTVITVQAEVAVNFKKSSVKTVAGTEVYGSSTLSS